jgi:Tol biopolymer transport system component
MEGLSRAAASLAIVVAAGCALAVSARAYEPPGSTIRVSVSSDGTQADGVFGFSSDFPWVSADGRYTAFYSIADNLVAEPTNQVANAYEHDSATGATTLVSAADDGTPGDKASFASSISDDGRYVAFESDADNLVPNDTNIGGADGNSEGRDAFVHDRITGTTVRVSVGSDGTEGNESSYDPNISATGRYVAFQSDAFNLVPNDTNGASDCFLHDMVTATTVRVSVASDGSEANSGSYYCKPTPDGRYVMFNSDATNLIPGTTTSHFNTYVHDTQTGVNRMVSVASDGTPGNDNSGGGSISEDGRYVVFSSDATNLVPGDTNGAGDVFVHDMVTGRTERASVTGDGAEANGTSEQATISSDGRYVQFWSDASNLLLGDTNGVRDDFVHDMTTGATDRVSVASDGTQGNASSWLSSLAVSGRYVAFESDATNLVPDDTNASGDIFERDRGPSLGTFGLSATQSGTALDLSGNASFAGVVLASVADPPDDGAAGAAALGGEITNAGVVYRPVDSALALRIDVTSMPATGSPGVLAGFDLTAGGVAYEVRAAAPVYSAPVFDLYRCTPSPCTQTAMLAGGYGTEGDSILVTLPLSAIGVAEGDPLTAIRAVTAIGSPAQGPTSALDDVALPDVTVAVRSVSVGIGPVGSGDSGVAYGAPVPLRNGTFATTIDTSSLPPGAYLAWARACLGVTCASSAVPFNGQPGTAIPEFGTGLIAPAAVAGAASLALRARRRRHSRYRELHQQSDGSE